MNKVKELFKNLFEKYTTPHFVIETDSESEIRFLKAIDFDETETIFYCDKNKQATMPIYKSRKFTVKKFFSEDLVAFSVEFKDGTIRTDIKIIKFGGCDKFIFYPMAGVTFEVRCHQIERITLNC